MINFKDYSLWSIPALIDRLDMLEIRLEANPLDAVTNSEYKQISEELDKRVQ